MLLRKVTLEAIRSGSVSMAFRRWRRPTVKAGGSLLTPIGRLAIEEVELVDREDITEADARAAGFSDLASLLAELEKHSAGDIYRVRLSLSGSDPRIALRGKIPRGEELDRILRKLTRLAWPAEVLRVIERRPGVRAADLASEVGLTREVLKRRVRSLKSLGLTESLKVGYRLSPRGAAVFEQLVGSKASKD